MTRDEIKNLKETMVSLIGNERDHVNAEWYNITEDEMDKIEEQAKEIIDWYLISYLKAEGYVDTDYKEDQEEDTEVIEEVIEEDVVTDEVDQVAQEIMEEYNREKEEERKRRKGTITFTGENINPNINYIIHSNEKKPYITDEELKRDYEFEKTSGEGHQLADDYHTMSELYFHRMLLFVTILKLAKEKGYKLYKSRLHHDCSKIDGYFIVGVITPEGQYAYHYNLKYWEYFNFVNEWERAPEWDGSKADDLHRLLSL